MIRRGIGKRREVVEYRLEIGAMVVPEGLAVEGDTRGGVGVGGRQEGYADQLGILGRCTVPRMKATGPNVDLIPDHPILDLALIVLDDAIDEVAPVVVGVVPGQVEALGG